jgi:hypothetical protein
MGRIKESDRLPTVDGHVGHWTEADALAGTPIEIETGYGLAQLQAQRDEYDAKGDDILQLAETELPSLRAERDALFGESDHTTGARFRLLLYKPLVKSKLGVRHPLVKTVPNIGRVVPATYLRITDRFLDHWARVNAALPTPLEIGDFAIADLQTAHTELEDKIKAITAAADGQLPLLRAEREMLFGDVAEDDREATSIIARLQLYQLTIQTQFPGQPIADSLPELFPSTTPGSLPTFSFNWNEPSPGQVQVWFSVPNLAATASVFMKEGIAEQTVPIDVSPGAVQTVTWDNVTMVDDWISWRFWTRTDSRSPAVSVMNRWRNPPRRNASEITSRFQLTTDSTDC